MPLILIRQDITKMRVDAIVNAANSELRQGGGVCGAVFSAAGEADMRRACEAIGHCDTGEAVLTPGFKLPARYVIHTVGPVWTLLGDRRQSERLLRACYINSLRLAAEQGFESIAFPLISSGSFGFPKDVALSVATNAIRDFLDDNDMCVYLTLFGREAYTLGVELSKELSEDIKAYIDDRYVEEYPFDRMRTLNAPKVMPEFEAQAAAPRSAAPRYKKSRSLERIKPKRIDIETDADPDPDGAELSPSTPIELDAAVYGSASLDAVEMREISLEDMLNQAEAGFADRLFNLIDDRGYTDPQVYRRANLDRKVFSKIRSNSDYHPSKNTVMALCVALQLDIDSAGELLRSAGYALSRGSKQDIIVEYFLRRGKPDIYLVNEALFRFNQPLLGQTG